MTPFRSAGPLTLLVVAVLSSCALTMDFDELQEGGEPSAGRGGRGGSNTGGDGAVSAGGDGAAAVGGSTGSDGGSPAEGGAAGAGGDFNVPLDEAAAVLAQTLCSKLEACVGPAALAMLLPNEDCATSTQTLLENTIVANVEQSQANGTLTYDGSAMPGCLEAYETLPCQELTIAFPEACKDALGGLAPEGGDCTHALECEAGLYCALDAACPGTCSTPLQENDPCTATDVCAPGLTCFQDACAPLGGEDADCGGDVMPGCVTGYLCLGADAAQAMPGTCISALDVFVLSEGQPCSINPPALCEVDAFCPIAFGAQCQGPAESGGTCQAAIPEMCPEGEFCAGGTCAALPGPNEPCRFSLNPLDARCEPYLRCVNNMCRQLSEIGEPCGSPAECHSGACGPDGECVPSACQ